MTPKQIRSRLKQLLGWKYQAGSKSIRTEVKCKDFMDAVRRVRKIARIAERMDHHPDLHLTRYRRLRIVLSTHDAGGVTVQDLKLAKAISQFL